MATLNRLPSFRATMIWEGANKLSTDPHDAGNYTGGRVGVGKLLGSRYGVSAMVAAQMGKTPATITEDDACAIFVNKYWLPVGADMMAIGVDHLVSDTAFNAGVGEATALWRKGGFLKSSDPIKTIHAYSALRTSFFRSLKDFPRYGKGWLNRVVGVEVESVKMAQAAVSTPPHEVVNAHDDTAGAAGSKVKVGGAGVVAGGIVATAVPLVSNADHTSIAVAAIMGVFIMLHQGWTAYVNSVRQSAFTQAAKDALP